MLPSLLLVFLPLVSLLLVSLLLPCGFHLLPEWVIFSLNLGINIYFGRNANFTHRIGVNNHFCSVIMARSDKKRRICLIICKMRNLFQQPCSCHCLHGCNRSGPVQQQPGDPEHACCEALLSSGQRARSGVGGADLVVDGWNAANGNRAGFEVLYAGSVFLQ